MYNIQGSHSLSFVVFLDTILETHGTMRKLNIKSLRFY